MSLEIINLHKLFGKTVALDGMNFTVEPGELYGFVGSNGAGKTTTMRIALGVLDKDSGEVRLNGKELDFETRKRFGYMPAERGLYPKMKVGEQLVFLAQLQGLSKADAVKAMEYWTERLNIDARRDDDVQALSLGNQQRVQLAAALIHNPDVLVLDEPFSGLDPMAVDVMSSVLYDKAEEGATVVFSSHQLDLVERMCHRVGICAKGKIVAEGTIGELRSSEGNGLIIRLDGDLNGLSNALSTGGVHNEKVSGDSLRLDLNDRIDTQAILRKALEFGAVQDFTHERPHLQDIFKDVVSIPDPTEAEEAEEPKKKGLAALFGRK